MPCRVDIGDAAQWQAADRAEAATGPVSILCNVVGVNGGGLIHDTPLKVWQGVYGINVEGQFIGVSTFLPRMKRRGAPAHILNTASIAGIVPMTPVAACSSSKFASVGFTLVLRDELKGTNISASLLVPGSVATRINITAKAGEARLLGQAGGDATEKDSSLLAKGADPGRMGEQVVEAADLGVQVFGQILALPIPQREYVAKDALIAQLDLKPCQMDRAQVLMFDAQAPLRGVSSCGPAAGPQDEVRAGRLAAPPKSGRGDLDLPGRQALCRAV